MQKRSFILFVLSLFFFINLKAQANFQSETENAFRSQEKEIFQHPRIHIFIHICAINNWVEVVERKLERMKASGLYDACEAIYFGILGEGDINSFIERYPKIVVLFQDRDLTKYERPTLLHMQAFCFAWNHNEVVLYMHSKGVTKTHPPVSFYVQDWAKYMEHFLIDRWRDCITALQDHDICGVNWHLAPAPHFSGNFWWARANYISTLPNQIATGTGYLEYIAPETWIGTNRPKVRCLFQSHCPHYDAPYPESNYIFQPNLPP